jgi:predicted permease
MGDRGMTVGEALRRLAAWWRRSRLERELDEEIALHLEDSAQELIESGSEPAEAGLAARRRFGNVTRYREEARDMWGFPTLESFLQDVRLGARFLARTPGLTATAVASLAVGIGAAAAVYGLADAALLRKLPVPEPDRLVLMRWTSAGGFPFESLSGSSDMRGSEASSTSFSMPAFEAIRTQTADRMRTVGFADLYGVAVSAEGQAEKLSGQVVSGNYFDVLGVRPAIGRAIDEGDVRPGAAPVAMLSYTYWQSRFGGAADVLGRVVRVNDVPFAVVGVLPRGFHGTLQVGQDPEVTLPLTAYGPVTRSEDPLRPGFWWVLLMARLEPGVTPADVEPAVTGIVQRLTAEARPDLPAAQLPRLRVLPGGRGQLEVRERMQDSLLPMALAVGVLLLVACANVASLLLARGQARGRELAVRVALGAPRLRIVRQLLTEGLVLALLGGLLGLALARVVGRALAPALLGGAGDEVAITATFDGHVVAFALLLSLACCLLFALVPALRTTLSAPSVHAGSRGVVGAPGHARLGRALVATQVSLSVLLLSAAALLTVSVRNLVRVDPGFDPRGVLLFSIDASHDDPAPARRTVEAVLERVGALPGVRSASLASHALISDSASIQVASRPDEARPQPGSREARPYMESHRAWALEVHEGFLATMGIELRRGRALGALDVDGAARVVLVNERLARQLYGTTDVVGRHLRFGLRDQQPVEIVGVTADARYASLRKEPPPTAYVPWRQEGGGRVTFVVRTTGDPLRLAAPVRDAVRDVDPDLPVVGLRTQEDQIRQSLTRERLFAGLATLLGVVTLALCAIGVFGLLAYTVSRRTQEMGVRKALGARPGELRWMVVRQSLAMTGMGLAIGAPAAAFGSRVLGSLLYGLEPGDPWLLAGTCLLLVLVSVAAAWWPARRAASVDPLVALRAE